MPCSVVKPNNLILSLIYPVGVVSQITQLPVTKRRPHPHPSRRKPMPQTNPHTTQITLPTPHRPALQGGRYLPSCLLKGSTEPPSASGAARGAQSSMYPTWVRSIRIGKQSQSDEPSLLSVCLSQNEIKNINNCKSYKKTVESLNKHHITPVTKA